MNGKLVEIVAAEVLSRVEESRLSLRHVMEEYFSSHPELEPIRGLVRAYLLGLLRRYRIIDSYALHVFDVDVTTMSYWRRALLRSIIYEAKFRDVGKDRLLAVIKAAKRLGVRIEWSDIVSVKAVPVKSILRQYSGVERVAVEYSLPTWVAGYLLKLLGREAYRLFKAFNRRQPSWIRVVDASLREEVVSALRKRGFSASPDRDLDDVVRVDAGRGLARTPEYRRGLFVIQEKASSLVPHLTGFKGVYIDLTAAPGVKISHVASRSGYGVGVDIKYRRLLAARNLAKRIRVAVDFVSSDSRLPPLREVDGVILDPDCSSLGRLGVSPEMRLWVTPGYVEKYSRLQWELLASAYRILRRGGRVIYSTCTLTVEENEENVRRAVEELGLSAITPEPFIGVPAIGVEGQRLYPHLHGTIGFFTAVMEKR